jgi:hypothetical protein
VLLSATLFQVACGENDAGNAARSPTGAARPAVGVVGGDPLTNYELTVENVRGLYQAHHGLYKLSQRDPEVLSKLEDDIQEIPPEQFEQIVSAIGAVPAVRKVLDQAKLTPRDFYLTQYNLVNAVAVLQGRAAGRFDHLPAVSEQSLDFVRRNPKDVEKVMTERRPKTE